MDKYDEMNPVQLLEEVRKLDRRINHPVTDDFLDGVRIEAAHQVGRWGAAHDRGKTPLDWFWLIGYLAQKAATAALQAESAKAEGLNDIRVVAYQKKALHHTISTAAALLNWHAQIMSEPLDKENSMRPGIDDQALHS
jgi:hypothetical protein